MQSHHEKPDVRLDRTLCVAGAIGSLLLTDWLVLGIIRDLDRTQPWRFLALAAAVGLTLFLGWMAFAASRVRYSMDADALYVRGALGQVEIPLTEIVNLYRWRQRWIWSGGPSPELGVDTVTLVPNTLLRMRSIWVVVYHTPTGERRALGILPSPKLLPVLKAWAWERKGLAAAKKV